MDPLLLGQDEKLHRKGKGELRTSISFVGMDVRKLLIPTLVWKAKKRKEKKHLGVESKEEKDIRKVEMVMCTRRT